jgi:glyoxylase I family protein
LPLTVTGYSHVRLTVTDIARSRRFYEDVFGFPVAYELPADADEPTRAALWFLFGGVIYALPDGQLLALRPAAPADDGFDPDRVGLDHLSLRVGDVDVAATHLDELGVPHGPVKELGIARMLELRDPDGIALELWESA